MKNILIIGGKQGIGKGLLDILTGQSDTNIIVTSRNFSKDLNASNQHREMYCDITSEKSIAIFQQQISDEFSHLNGIINCAGILHTKDYLPEKSLSQISSKQLSENYQTNAMGHLLLLKTMEKHLAQSKNPFAVSISARIGSIKDNHLGGWYSYRMSKAALNMGFKTLEIEWKRKYPHIKLLLIHPGTTDTNLSKPFQKRLRKGQLHSIEKTSELIINQIDKKLNGQLDGLFVDFNGQPIEW